MKRLWIVLLLCPLTVSTATDTRWKRVKLPHYDVILTEPIGPIPKLDLAAARVENGTDALEDRFALQIHKAHSAAHRRLQDPALLWIGGRLEGEPTEGPYDGALSDIALLLKDGRRIRAAEVNTYYVVPYGTLRSLTLYPPGGEEIRYEDFGRNSLLEVARFVFIGYPRTFTPSDIRHAVYDTTATRPRPTNGSGRKPGAQADEQLATPDTSAPPASRGPRPGGGTSTDLKEQRRNDR